MGKYNASSFSLPCSALLQRSVLVIGIAAIAGCTTPVPVPAASAVTAAVTPVNAPDEAQTAMAPPPDDTVPLTLRDDAPLRYVVRSGDTLWDIAAHFLRDPWQWPELWYGNSQLRNPHRIYPGDVLTLVHVDGRPRLLGPSRQERLSPSVREQALDTSLPAIPIDAIRNFLRGPRLVTLDEAKRAPYVVAFADERLAVGANSDVYVNSVAEPAASRYALVRVGEPYRDPETRKLLGYEAIPIGEAELQTPQGSVGDTRVMRVTQSAREVLIADRLLPIEAESFNASFFPHPPSAPVDGRILSVFDGMSQISQFQIVALNRGAAHGLDPGTVLDILQSGRVVTDPYTRKPVTLPDQYAGVLMVFKVAPELSYALVISATRPLHVRDKVVRPTVTAQR